MVLCCFIRKPRNNELNLNVTQDSECCTTTVMQDGHELKMWLFVDLKNFEIFCKQCTESIDCCIACYSITIGQTYRNVVEKVENLMKI